MKEFKVIGEKVGSGLPLPISTDVAERTLVEITSGGLAQVCREMYDFTNKKENLSLIKLLSRIADVNTVNYTERGDITEGFYLGLKLIKNSFETSNGNFPFPSIKDKDVDKRLAKNMEGKMSGNLVDFVKRKIEIVREIDPVFIEFMSKITAGKEPEQRDMLIHGATEAYLIVDTAINEPFN